MASTTGAEARTTCIAKRCESLKVLNLGKFDGDVGGIERHVRALLGGMPPEVEVTNLVSNQFARTETCNARGYTTHSVASYASIASFAVTPAMPAVARALHRRHHFDIVHLHFPDPLGHLTALALPRSVKRVITWHSDIIRQRWALAAYAPLMRRFVREADALIGATPQHFSASTQMPLRKDEQIRAVIPYGFDPAALTWTDAARARHAELKARHRGALIFTVGRHVYYKGFEVLIRSMRDVDADLIIGGRGPLTASLKQAARDAGVERKVHFAGFIADDELIAYYDACDVFCMPSTERAEQFGLVQLEAMACSKPVVTTRLGTGVEYVTLDGETGILVPPGDGAALAHALNVLLTDPALRERQGAAGRRRVESVFSVNQMVEATLDVYRQVMRRSHAGVA